MRRYAGKKCHSEIFYIWVSVKTAHIVISYTVSPQCHGVPGYDNIMQLKYCEGSETRVLLPRSYFWRTKVDIGNMFREPIRAWGWWHGFHPTRRNRCKRTSRSIDRLRLNQVSIIWWFFAPIKSHMRQVDPQPHETHCALASIELCHIPSPVKIQGYISKPKTLLLNVRIYTAIVDSPPITSEVETWNRGTIIYRFQYMTKDLAICGWSHSLP